MLQLSIKYFSSEVKISEYFFAGNWDAAADWGFHQDLPLPIPAQYKKHFADPPDTRFLRIPSDAVKITHRRELSMHLAIRSTLTAGIALAGAGAIAVSPISPVAAPVADAPVAIPHSSWAPVELTALADGLLQDPSLTDPLTEWLGVFGTTFDNAAKIGGQMAADPFPILQQVIANQMANGQLLASSLDAAAMSYISFFTSDEDYKLKFLARMALDYLESGDVAGVASVVTSVVFRLFAFANPLLNIMQLPLRTGQNVMNALSAVPDLMMPLGLGVLNPVEGAINAFGDSAQHVLNAVNAGDPAAAFSSLINTPAVLTDAILNGYLSDMGAGTSGLFTNGEFVLNRGLLQTLLVTVPQTIAKAIGWQGPGAMQMQGTAIEDVAPAPTDVGTDLPTASPLVQRKALGTAAVVSHPAADVTSTVDRISETTSAAVEKLKTVTLSVAPQRNAVDAQTAGTPAENDGAEVGSGSAEAPASSATPDAKTEAKSGRDDRLATRAAKRAAKQEAKAAGAEAKVQHRAAKRESNESKQEAKAGTSGAKHRAGGDHSD
ncbi:hypothetical protein [Mycobacterium sp. NPDC004974]